MEPYKNFFDNCLVDTTRKKGQNIFSLERLPFFKNLSFQQPLMCYRNDLIASAVIARKPLGPLQFVP